MPDPAAFDRVLRLVAEGRLTAEEAARSSTPSTEPPMPTDETARARRRPGSACRRTRPRVAGPGHRSGRTIINLRIPLALGRAAIGHVPGLSEATSERIREAIDAGLNGPILDVDDDGDGVRISIE